MIEKIQLLRNVGQFDSVDSGGQLPFSKMTLLFAENGRGKTTLASILHSLRTDDPNYVSCRKRLASSHSPHIVLSTTGTPPFIFNNGSWSAPLPRLAVFDDLFVAQNVCSGIEIAAEQRQNLHELILGAKGVTLNNTLKTHIAKIEEHNRELRIRADAIPPSVRGSLTVDAFCNLKANPKISEAIQEAEKSLAAGRSAAAVQAQSIFTELSIPDIDTEALNKLLARDLPGLEETAVVRVQSHIATLGSKGEKWVGDGMIWVAQESEGQKEQVCPFCAQGLGNSPVIGHYRAYFGEEYASLKADIASTIKSINAVHGGDTHASFERAVRVAVQNQEFWKSFLKIDEVVIDTAAISRSWVSAREAVLNALLAKQAAPLDSLALSADAIKSIKDYKSFIDDVESISARLMAANEQIELVKEKAATANIATLEADLSKLKAVEARHSPNVIPLCQSYVDEKAAKRCTEALREQARESLDQYRQTVFPAYESAINTYLQKFNAGFRIESVCSVNNRGGSSCTYNILINNIPVSLSDPDGGPSFRNTLSAGDRNTLALAFFFASLDLDPDLAQKIVIIDDPMTSLDEHRSLTTIQEMRRLIGRVSQVIVLSHSKPFLCALWQNSDTSGRTAIKIVRDGTGSTLGAWDVHEDCVTENDRRHALVTAYIQGGHGLNEREVAAALRPILESFMRVAYPTTFPPGTLLGPFIGICSQRKGTPSQILSEGDIEELRNLLEFANKFHHDTNPAWESEAINDQALQHFCERTLAFARRT